MCPFTDHSDNAKYKRCSKFCSARLHQEALIPHSRSSATLMPPLDNAAFNWPRILSVPEAYDVGGGVTKKKFTKSPHPRPPLPAHERSSKSTTIPPGGECEDSRVPPPPLPKATETEVDAVENGRRQAVAVRGGESVGLVKAAVAEGGRGAG